MTTANNDSVRRLIYGGSTRSGTLSTADIASFVAENGNVYLAASEAAMAEMAVNVSAPTNRKVGDLSVSFSADYLRFRDLSRSLRKRGLRAIKPFAGGITISNKDAERDESDRVAPAFAVGQFDNPVTGSSS